MEGQQGLPDPHMWQGEKGLNGWNEPIILTRPRNRKHINRLCSRAPEPTVKTGQLSIFMICKSVCRMRTLLALGHKKIISLDPSVTIVDNSTQKIGSIISRSRDPFNFQSDVIRQAHAENVQCKTLQVFLHTSNFKLQLAKCKKDSRPKEMALCKKSSSEPPRHSTSYEKWCYEIIECN